MTNPRPTDLGVALTNAIVAACVVENDHLVVDLADAVERSLDQVSAWLLGHRNADAAHVGAELHIWRTLKDARYDASMRVVAPDEPP